MADERALGDTSVRALSNEFRNASDAKLLKVTRMIDLLPARGAADALLDPMRARLATLRPARGMNPTRLLFTPFDPILVSSASWRPGDFAVPRSILGPASLLVFAAGSVDVPDPAALAEADGAALTRAGAPLWKAAAARLATATIPEAWTTDEWQKQNGLTVPMIAQLLPVLRLVLRHAATIRTLPPRHDPAAETALYPLLLDAMRSGTLAWGIMLALLFVAAAPDQVARTALALTRAERCTATMQGGLDRAIEDMLDRIEAARPVWNGRERLDAAALQNRLRLIERIEELRELENRPVEEQRRIARLRRGLAAENRAVFEQTLQERLEELDRPSAAASDLPPMMSADAMLAMEAQARQLRVFALAASKLAGGEEYDRMLEQAAARYTRDGGKVGMTRADRMRVIELLAGSERAIQALGDG